MVGTVVTFEEMVDLAIVTPGCAINLCVLKKLLKLFTKYCCKKDYTFEIDMDNLSLEAKMISKKSRSSVSVDSRKSSESSVYSKRSDTSDERSVKKETKIKSERNVKTEYEEENVQVKAEKDSQVYSFEGKMYDSSSDIPKEWRSSSEKQNQTEASHRKDEKVKEKKEKKHKKDSDSHRKKYESEGTTSEKHKKKTSDDDVRKKEKRKEGHEDLSKLEHRTNELEYRRNELENRVAQLSDRIESITETIGTHLNAEHLAELNNEIDKLKKRAEVTSDQCYETANSMSDQSTQIQEILTTINDIQLRKVENEELIDLLSGKADYSFVDEKVATSHFEEKIQELKDVIGEGAVQLDSARLETNNSFDEIKQDLATKLVAEEFDEAKAKIYKELMKLTEQHALILAQQNEHVAAGAKMRNLNCFVCNNDVVMLLEQEVIPKFRPLKASQPPLEPVIGSKVLIGKNGPEWKNHLLQTKNYTRDSKASRFHSNVDYQRSTYIKGRNGCMYKGNVGCDCVEAMNGKRVKCCGMVQANNLKNISVTNQMNSESKVGNGIAIGDMVDGCCKKIDDKGSITQIIPTNQPVEKLTTPEITVKIERTVETPEVAHKTDNVVDPVVIKVKEEIVTTPDITVEIERPIETLEETHETKNVEGQSVIEIKEETISINKVDSNTANEGNGILADTNDGMSNTKTENDEPAPNGDAPIGTNSGILQDDAAANQ